MANSKQLIHNWGPWDTVERSAGGVVYDRYFQRECVDCKEHETARERYLCEVR